MNALYARPDGEVVDPLNGMADLHARRVRFIGTAENRIREDYLRTLRYFRFHSWYGDAEAGFDSQALAAIAANLDGLAQLSLERVTAELLKLLSAADPAPSVAVMRQTGVLGQLLPGAEDRALAPLIHLEGGLSPDPIRRLAALGGADLLPHLRLSKAQARTLDLLRNAATGTQSVPELAYRLGRENAHSAALLRVALLEQPISPDLEVELDCGAAAAFPLVAADLMPALSGRALGAALKKLEQDWIISGFALSREELLGKL